MNTEEIKEIISSATRARVGYSGRSRLYSFYDGERLVELMLTRGYVRIEIGADEFSLEVVSIHQDEAATIGEMADGAFYATFDRTGNAGEVGEIYTVVGAPQYGGLHPPIVRPAPDFWAEL